MMVLKKKIIVDYRDKKNIDDFAYSWCDVYGKVNNDLLLSDKYKEKVIAIGPDFGLQIYSFFVRFIMA
jgi:hypothetical protein